MNPKVIGRTLRLGVLVYVQTVILVAAAEVLWPRDTVPAPADAIVCLGAGATETALNADSRARTDRCVDLFDEGIAPRVVFTGFAAAPLMAERAMGAGIPREAILVEEDSRSTLQNALFTAPLLAEDARVVLVSSAYHLPRSLLSFRTMGYGDITLAAANGSALRPSSVLREGAVVWFNLGRMALWWLTPWLPEDARARLMA